MLHNHFKLPIVVLVIVILICNVQSLKQQALIEHDHQVPFLGEKSGLTLAELKSIVHKSTIISKLDDPILSSTIQLSVTPNPIVDGAQVLLAWSNFPQATTADYITITCGPTVASLGFDDYLDKLLNVNGTAEGYFNVDNLIMMRCDYKFTYVYAPNGSAPMAVAQLTVPMSESYNTPKQGHLAFTSNVDEMALMYISGSTQNTPLVRYGLIPGFYDTVVSGTSKTYNASNLCHYPANVVQQKWFRDPGFIHTVILQKLAPSTTYYYQYGNDVDGWSDERHFLSRPVAGWPTAKFLAYADMGFSFAPAAHSTAIRSQLDILNGYNNFLLHFGDISYALGGAWSWDAWFSMIEPYATLTPYMVSIGNHEYDYITGGANDPSGSGNSEGWHPKWGNMNWDSRGECGVPVYNRFTSPANGNSIFWYSFDYGPVHIIQMSTEHDWTRGSLQYNWIAQDLASLDRTVTPFVIITGHRMMYTTQLEEDGDYKVSLHFQQEMEELIYQNKVNLMLVGHQHSYERSCPVYNQTCQEDGKGTVHVIVGSAGAGLETGGFSNKFGNYSIAHIEDWGYCRISATLEQLSLDFVLNRSGEVFDHIDLQPWL